MSHPTDASRRAASSAAGKPTLEMLLRLKRAERPDAAFWAEFDRGLRQKQLAAIIEPKPWWLGLALLGRRLTPAGLPISAAAAAVLAVMVVRTQSPVITSSAPVEFGPSQVVQTEASEFPAPSTATLAKIEPDVPAAGAASAGALDHSEPEIVSVAPADTRPIDTPTVATAPSDRGAEMRGAGITASLLELASLDLGAPTPSQLTIAQNLATLRAEAPELVDSITRLETASRAIELPENSAVEPAALKMEVRNPRHARVILAMTENSAIEAVGGLSQVRDRMVRSLAATDAFANSSSRLGVGGDRLSLSF
jgi:hypothetical protein